MQAARYNIVHNDLYEWTYGGPLVKCLGPNQRGAFLKRSMKGIAELIPAIELWSDASYGQDITGPP